jgi:hypothetical protein
MWIIFLIKDKHINKIKKYLSIQIKIKAKQNHFHIHIVYYHTQYVFHTSGCKQTFVQSFIGFFSFLFPLADNEMKGNGLG